MEDEVLLAGPCIEFLPEFEDCAGGVGGVVDAALVLDEVEEVVGLLTGGEG